VCTFSFVPLKTYLPDGDIDLTALCDSLNLKYIWANQVQDLLKNEEKNKNAEFHVKEVHYIQDEVDHLTNQNHLFKRSIILIKAWCYYESRKLGAGSDLQYFTAEPPRKDSGELLLSKLFLDACSSVYAVLLGGQENNGQPFVSKHFNVIDPLRVNNNLGLSVSKDKL
ncbi:PAP/OAS1 substrate-binding domain superfamily, partial [Striga asiatica]